MILKDPANGTPQTVLKIQVCLFFLEQICTLRSFDSEYYMYKCIVHKKSSNILGIPSFEILNQNPPQRIFQMWSDTRKRILIFFQMVQAFKGWESYVYRTWSSSLVNVLWCDFATRSWQTKAQSKGDKSVFKIYRVFSLPRFYLGELSRGNFGAIPQPNRGKKTSYCGNTEGNPRVGPAATTR